MTFKRYDHVFQKYSGSREMCEAEDGNWMKVEDHELRVGELETGLLKAADTFRDLAVTLSISGRRLSAEACLIAEKAMRDLLLPPRPQTEPDVDGEALLEDEIDEDAPATD